LIEFVIIIAERSTTFDQFSNFDEFFVKEEKRRRNFLQKMKNHEQRRIIDNFLILILSSTRDSLLFVTHVTTSSRNVVVLFSFRISKISRRWNVVETKFDELFIDRFVVKEKNDDELIDENDDELLNYVKCCRVLMFCRRVIDIACAKCFKQKQTFISICFRFAFFWRFSFNNIKFLFDLKMRFSNWLTLESRCVMRSLRRRFFNVNVLFSARISRRDNERKLIEKMSMIWIVNS
jgi:hypothetical protein